MAMAQRCRSIAWVACVIERNGILERSSVARSTYKLVNSANPLLAHDICAIDGSVNGAALSVDGANPSIIIIIIMQLLTRHMSVSKMTKSQAQRSRETMRTMQCNKTLRDIYTCRTHYEWMERRMPDQYITLNARHGRHNKILR